MAAATTYETTCPNCGEDFDVRAADSEADCPTCGAHLIFRDEEEERKQREKEQAEAAAAKAKAQEEAARLKAEQDAIRQQEREEAARLKAEQDAIRQQEREEAARRKEEERAAKAAEKLRLAEQKAQIAAHAAKVKEAQKQQEEEERERLRAERAETARGRFLTRPDRSPANDPQGIPVIDLEGVGPKMQRLLGEHGIHTTDQLLGVDDNKLAEATGIPVKKIRDWQDMSDLIHLPGIGPQYAEVLVRVDINSVKELSLQDPKDLNKKIQDDLDSVQTTVTAGKIGPGLVKRWIEEARSVYPLEEDPGEKALHDVQETSGPAKLDREPAHGQGGKSLAQLERQKQREEAAALKAKAAAAKKEQDAVKAADKEKAQAKAAKEKAKAAEEKAKAAEAAAKAKAEAKQQAKQDKQDRKDAKGLAKALSVSPDIALRLVKADVRTVEDLADQDPQKLHKKLQEAKA